VSRGVRAAAAILAAGGSERFGSPKQLARIGDATLLDLAVAAAIGSRCDPVMVILGAARERIAPDLRGRPLEIVDNPEWERGMASSIRVAVGRALAYRDPPKALVLIACDQPRIGSGILDRLLDAFDPPRITVVACRYAGGPGIPTLFGSEHFAALLALQGDRGAKSVLRQNADRVATIPWPDGEIDVDTPGDLDRFLAENGPGDPGGAARDPHL
jgi:molybdenum cofactor cytidylyltransferase